jgi:Trypsin-co-occurring domain 1
MTSATIIPVPVEVDGVTFLVEATHFKSEDENTLTDEEIEAETSGKILSFEDVTKTITAISSGLAKTLSTVKPTKATVEFGVEFQHEPGKLLAVIVQGSSKINLKITLEWSK